MPAPCRWAAVVARRVTLDRPGSVVSIVLEDEDPSRMRRGAAMNPACAPTGGREPALSRIDLPRHCRSPSNTSALLQKISLPSPSQRSPVCKPARRNLVPESIRVRVMSKPVRGCCEVVAALAHPRREHGHLRNRSGAAPLTFQLAPAARFRARDAPRRGRQNHDVERPKHLR
jgi:hypothetical protein